MSEHQERRRFKRIPFDAPTELIQGDQRWNVELIDISLKGLLIECPRGWSGDGEQSFDAIVQLGKAEVVNMQVQLRHIDEHHLGFICLNIDLTSMEHLRRIVELNLADGTELGRELRQLIEV